MLEGGAHIPGDEPISDLIRHGRLTLGLSQERLARQLAATARNPGLTRAHVARWERGSRLPGPYWRHWLAIVLDVPESVLIRSAAVARIHRISSYLEKTGGTGSRGAAPSP